MTEEVGRLHREKQQVENQISDLFTFYSKHKQEPVRVSCQLHRTAIKTIHLASPRNPERRTYSRKAEHGEASRESPKGVSASPFALPSLGHEAWTIPF